MLHDKGVRNPVMGIAPPSFSSDCFLRLVGTGNSRHDLRREILATSHECPLSRMRLFKFSALGEMEGSRWPSPENQIQSPEHYTSGLAILMPGD